MSLLLTIFLFTAPASAGWWSDFCERHIVAEDPYQFEHLSVDKLVYVYWLNKNQNFKSKALINEMKARLVAADLSSEELEILKKTLANERD